MAEFKSSTSSVQPLELRDISFKGDWTYNFNKKAILILCVAGALLIVGIALIAVQKSEQCPESSGSKQISTGAPPLTTKPPPPPENACSYSSEAKRVKLGEYLNKVKETYYMMFPEHSALHPDATTDTIKFNYRAHDPNPKNIKKITDAALALLKEADIMVRSVARFSDLGERLVSYL